MSEARLSSPGSPLSMGEARSSESEVTLSPEELPASTSSGGATRLMTVDPRSYQITGAVAQGGIGRILRARSVSLDRPVAIKELLASAGPIAEERFLREALLTARLQHPSIVPIYEAGRWPNGAPFYAMKYVSGRSLADVIFECWSLDQRLGLLHHVLAVAEAMAYAHSERIIHRDLKPANILVGAFGETVVIDWGLAKDLAEEPQAPSMPPGKGPPVVAGADVEAVPPEVTPRPPVEGLTMEGAIMGTPAYMPLEQATGEQVDERADVYALGAILYHLLAGVSPYDGASGQGILRKVITRAPEPLEQRQKGIPEDLLTIVKKAMARDRTDRYRTAKELAEDLRRFHTGQIVGAHKYSPVERIRRFARRHRAAVSVGAAALVLLCITFGLGFHHNLTQRYRAEAGEEAAHRAEQKAVAHADDLTLVQARAAASRDPNEAIAWLKSLSPSFSRWPEARLIAADAEAHGIATVLRGHTAAINHVAFSPDGKQIATVSDDHTARLWTTATGESRTLQGHMDEVWVSSFSPSGKLLATAGKDGTIRIWDVQTGAIRRVLAEKQVYGMINGLFFVQEDLVVSGIRNAGVYLWHVPTGQVRLAADHVRFGGSPISPDRRLLTLAGSDRLHILDLESGQSRSFAGSAAQIVTTAFSPDGKSVISQDVRGDVFVWNIESGKGVRLADPPARPAGGGFWPLATSSTFSRDGKLLASAGYGADVHLWDIAARTTRRLEGHQSRTSSVSFSPDGKLLASGSYDHTVRLWNLASGDSRIFRGFDDYVTDLAFSPDGKMLAAVSAHGTMRLLSVTSSPDQVLTHHAGRLLRVVFSPDGELLASGGQDGNIRISARAGGPSTLFEGHKGAVRNLVFSPDGELLASSGDDQIARVWDLSGHPIWSVESVTFIEQAPLAFSPDGQLVAAPGAAGGIALLDVDSGMTRTLRREPSLVMTLAFSPDSRRIAAGSINGKITLYDVASGESRSIGVHEQAVSALAFSSSGARLASGSLDHTVGFWDVATGEGRRISASGSGVSEIAFLQEDRVAVTLSTLETKVRVWDMTTFLERKPLGGHEAPVTSFSFFTDKRRLATASLDGTVRLWSLESGESRVLTGHTDGITSVAFSPDGKIVASASLDATVRLWTDDLPEDGAALRAWIDAAAPDTINLYHQDPAPSPPEFPIR